MISRGDFHISRPLHAIDAVALDLDGTLIGPNEKIAPSVRDSVRVLATEIPVFICTGRERWSTEKFARELGLTSLQISDNGAVIVDPMAGWEPVWNASIRREAAVSIIEVLGHRDLSFFANNADYIFRDLRSAQKHKLSIISALDMTSALANELIAHFRNSEFSEDFQVNKSSLPYNGLWAVDFTPSGVDKGSALQRVSDRLNICLEKIAAVGDSFNDIPMFEKCGFSMSMGEAPSQVQEFSDVTVPNQSEGGLVFAIERIIRPAIKLD